MSKILITGGLGLIGAHVCKRLIELGHEPIIFDQFIQYHPPLESEYQKYVKYRFKDIKNKVIIERGNIEDKERFREVMRTYKPSKIIHLAALPIAEKAKKHPEEAINSIGIGTANILQIIKNEDYVDRFVFISSSMVYGDFQKESADENHPTNPKDIYGATKLYGELLTKLSGAEGLNYAIIRPSAVYGPTDVNKRVSQIFVENAVDGKPLKLFNNGEEKLDFTYVEDTAEGIVLATFEPKAKGETFNITCGQGRSLREFADILKKYFPDLKIELIPYDSDLKRPKRGTLDIAKARKILGYNPKFPLEKGIPKYIEFVKSMRK